MTPRRVTVSIDRLVLHGVQEHDRRAVAAALERELADTLARDGVPAGLPARTELPRVHARMAPPRSAGPQGHGAAIAAAVYRGLGG